MADYKKILKDNKLRVTPMRKLLLELFDSSKVALSNQDIEEQLPENSDRITVYRTLKAFQEKGIIHKAVDGTDVARYALCHSDCDEHEHNDEHIHFHCQQCDNTYCLDEMIVPQIQAPNGFRVSTINMVMNGVCDRCSGG